MSGDGLKLAGMLALREQYRDRYTKQRDPLSSDRLLWRAQSFRHLVHLLPGQTVLELGCGEGLFTRQLYRVSRGQNPITAITLLSRPSKSRATAMPSPAEIDVEE